MKFAFYDEQQIHARGQAYQAAFWTGTGYLFFVGVAGLPDGIQTFRLQFLLRNPEWWGLVIMNLVYSTVAIWKDAYFGWRMGNLICGSLFLGMGVLFLQRLTVEPLAEKYLPFFELIVFCCLTMCWTGILALLRWFISSKVRRSA